MSVIVEEFVATASLGVEEVCMESWKVCRFESREQTYASKCHLSLGRAYRGTADPAFCSCVTKQHVNPRLAPFRKQTLTENCSSEKTDAGKTVQGLSGCKV